MDNKDIKTPSNTNTSTSTKTESTNTSNTVFSPVPLKLITESDHSQSKNTTIRKKANR